MPSIAEDAMLKRAKAGEPELLKKEKEPRMPSAHACSQALKASSWFLGLYQNLAEPYASEDPLALDLPQNEIMEEPDHPLWNVAKCLATEDGEKRFVPRRFLNPGCVEDLYLQYEMEEGVFAVSRSTFLKVWNSQWKRYIKFRNVGQGKRCRICARLDEERLQATTHEEKLAIVQKKKDHIGQIMADREVSVRCSHMSEKAAQEKSMDGMGQVLKLTIDGMDQAKFKCPRFSTPTAEWEGLFRPSLHVVGAIAHGHAEMVFIMDADQPKDSNMVCTVLSRILDIVHDTVQILPRHLILSVDNTTRENKNQHLALMVSALVSSKRFESCEVQYFQVGHTHNEQDQRFSSIATVLARAPSLEDAKEFRDYIQTNVRPVRGRAMHVELLEETYDFQKWISGAGVQVSGLAATHLEPNTCHLWRFIPRSMLPLVLDHQADVQKCDAWVGLPENDSDVVLLVKQYLHSSTLAQEPLLFLPEVLAGKLQKQQLGLRMRNPLGERVAKEFLKTAAAVSRPPWNLVKAQAYLEALVRNNESGHQGTPPTLNFIFEYEIKTVSGVNYVMDVVAKSLPRLVCVQEQGALKMKGGQSGKNLLKRPAAGTDACERKKGKSKTNPGDAGLNVLQQDPAGASASQEKEKVDVDGASLVVPAEDSHDSPAEEKPIEQAPRPVKTKLAGGKCIFCFFALTFHLLLCVRYAL